MLIHSLTTNRTKDRGPLTDLDHQVPTEFDDFLPTHVETRDVDLHRQLQNDIVEYLWALKETKS